MSSPASPVPTVDLNAAILPQVEALGDSYEDWVYGAKRFEGSVRIFRSGWLEALSRTPYWLVPLVWLPVIAALGWLGWQAIGPLSLLAHLGVGLIIWAFIEYFLHRFLFHGHPRRSVTRRLHFLGHGIHHLVPSDPMRLVFPPLPAGLIAGLIFVVLRLALPPGNAIGVLAGIVVGYVGYDMTHYYTHHGRPKNRIGRWLREYHMVHHHKLHRSHFGVTQPLIDLLFGTFRAR